MNDVSITFFDKTDPAEFLAREYVLRKILT